MTTRIREGRYCDATTILRQIGGTTVMAVTGGRYGVIRDSEKEVIGVQLICSANRTVEVTLSFMDTYTVRRYRTVVRGERRGDDIVEYEANDIYCDQLSDVVYTAGCWK